MKYITRKSLLNKSSVEYADFCINHVEGCSHGCTFPCYAKQMSKRFGKVKKDSDWLKPKLVGNALELLDKEIPKYKNAIKFVHLCFMTDPFMYDFTHTCNFSEIEEMTVKIIEKLNRNNIKCTILTKGLCPKSLAVKNRFSLLNEYGITLVSLNDEFKDRFEPFASPYADRIKSLKYLHEHGLKTWVSMEPYPTPNLDNNQNLGKLLHEIRFVDRIIFGKLNYNMVSSLYKDNHHFYEECANQVIEFCQENCIDYHIKFGTQKRYNQKTEILFKPAISSVSS